MVLSRRRERIAALAIAAALVLARSYVFIAYEQAHFDSDQAIVGLMAKHLSEGRAFPLFFYGQPYMLALEAWLAVPIFWIAGPTVAALRATIILMHLATAVLLIVGLERCGGLRPLHALVASLFFVFPPPLTAAYLLSAHGGTAGPFLFVPLLWLLRRRPLWFGFVLAIGFLTREFTMYAVPVLLAGQAWTGRPWRAATLRAWLLALVAFLSTWDSVHVLKPYADLTGPGTRGELLWGIAGSQIANLFERGRFTPQEIPERVVAMVRAQMPLMLGGMAVDDPIARQGRDWMAWPLGIALAAAAVRLGWLVLGGKAAVRSAAFGWYLLGVGLVAVAAYVAARPVIASTVGYVLLALLMPVGVTAVLLALEPRRWVRRAAIAAVLAWGALAGADNARQLERYLSGREPNDLRILADALVARDVRVAEAGYWRAYRLTFLTGERVKVASTDFIRIEEYQRLAAAEGEGLLRIQDRPCPGGERIAHWYLCRRVP